MGLEAATYINQLNPLWPLGASDPVGQGDDHLRMLKATIQATFPNITGPVTLTQAQINSITGLANPSALAGMTAINGVATTAMRSDGAPAINPAIAPVWTALHKFTHASGLAVENSAPHIRWTENDQAADSTSWLLRVQSATFNFAAYDDALSAGKNFLSAVRGAATSIATVNIGNATDNPTLNVLGTGQTNIGGSVVVTGSTVLVSNSDPSFQLTDTGVAVDNRRWMINANGTFDIYALLDGGGSAFNPTLRVNRSGEAITNMQFGNAVNNPTYNFAGTGVITKGGVARGPNGASGAPTWSFTSETTLGWYRNAAGSLRASVNADIFEILAASSGGAKVADFGGTLQTVGYRAVPRSTTATTLAIGDLGKCVAITAAINIPASVFSAGDCLSIYNDSAGSLNLTISAGTLRLGGTTTTGTRAIAARGMCTIWFNVGGATPEAIASGPGVS